LVTDQRLATGDWLQLKVTLSERAQPLPVRLDLRGEVVRTDDARGAGGVGVALDTKSMRLLRASRTARMPEAP
jgi:hypothetical protein